MGQKTHPVGYRLSVNKKWNSNWFASKNNFSSELEEDVKIRKYVSHRLPNAGISKVEIARTSKKVTITIHTARPGIVIGRGGEEVNRLKKELRQLTGKKDAQINISEVKRPELDAALVGSNIAHQLKKKISYRRVVNKTIQSTMRMGAEGIRINVAGRLGGVEIARSEKFSDGSTGFAVIIPPRYLCVIKLYLHVSLMNHFQNSVRLLNHQSLYHYLLMQS